MKCPECNFENQNDAKFCCNCGAAITPPSQEPASVIYCPNCGLALQPDAMFCPRCGFALDSGNVAGDGKSSAASRTSLPGKKKVLIIAGCILAVLLLAGITVFILVKTDVIENPFSKDRYSTHKADDVDRDDSDRGDDRKKSKSEEQEAEEHTFEEPASAVMAEDEIPAALKERLNSISEQTDTAKDKLKDEDYSGAADDLSEILTAYADMVSEYNDPTTADNLDLLVDDTFALYTRSVLKQVEGLENQPVSAALYQQIDGILSNTLDFVMELQEYGLDINAEEIKQNYAAFPDRYKEKFILAFNDLRTGNQWSRTTAWQYMQDAASVGLVDRNDPDDPLTLRYAYALAWITEKEIKESVYYERMDYDMAVDAIVSVIENADYNPVLTSYLFLCNDMRSGTNSDIIRDACEDVYNYLVDEENIYIIDKTNDNYFNRITSNTAVTIELDDFWYFNDFGKYSPSNTNGVSPAGRQYIRMTFKNAVDTLKSRW